MFRVLGRMVIVIAVLGGWIGLGAAEVKAGLLPVSADVTQNGGTYTYTYGVVLTSNSVLKSGDYFTIYDFNGLVNGSNQQPTGFTFSTSNVGPTPTGTLPTDNPSIPNATWTYTGPTLLAGQIALGNFILQSTVGTTSTGSFTGSSQRQVDGVDENNITTTTIPVPSSCHMVPEPGSLALAAVGLPLFGLLRIRRRSATVNK